MTEWPPIGKIAAHSAYDMFYCYKYLIVSHLGFWSGNLFLIVPFPDLCLLIPSNVPVNSYCHVGTLAPFYGTLTQNVDLMTSKNCFKYNHAVKPIRLICMDGLYGRPLFPGRLI